MKEDKIVKQYVRIPLFLIERTLQETKNINMLRLYLYLNSRSSGHFRFEHGDRAFIAKELGIKPQSVSNNLNRLIERNWVGYNQLKDLYHIRGFRTIKKQEQARGHQAVEINVETELKDKKSFEALIWAAYIGNFARSQQRKAERKQREECHTGGSKHKRCKRDAFFPVAVSVIEKCLGVSRSTACLGRAMAVEYGYLEVKKSFKLISSFEAQARYYEGGKEAAVVRRIDGKFFIEQTHLIRIRKLQYCRMPRFKKIRPQHAILAHASHAILAYAS